MPVWEKSKKSLSIYQRRRARRKRVAPLRHRPDDPRGIETRREENRGRRRTTEMIRAKAVKEVLRRGGSTTRDALLTSPNTTTIRTAKLLAITTTKPLAIITMPPATNQPVQASRRVRCVTDRIEEVHGLTELTVDPTTRIWPNNNKGDTSGGTRSLVRRALGYPEDPQCLVHNSTVYHMVHLNTHRDKIPGARSLTGEAMSSLDSNHPVFYVRRL